MTSNAVRVLFALRSAAERVASFLAREICFGAVGRFWGGETAWETIEANEFEAFDRPGFARIAGTFVLRPLGSDRTLISYETRTQGTDTDATRVHPLLEDRVPVRGDCLAGDARVIERDVARSHSWR